RRRRRWRRRTTTPGPAWLVAHHRVDSRGRRIRWQRRRRPWRSGLGAHRPGGHRQQRNRPVLLRWWRWWWRRRDPRVRRATGVARWGVLSAAVVARSASEASRPAGPAFFSERNVVVGAAAAATTAVAAEVRITRRRW